MKFLKVATILVFIFVLGVAVWNKVQVGKCAEKLQDLDRHKRQLIHDKTEVENAFVKAQSYSMTHLDRQILFMDLEQVHPKAAIDIQKLKGPRLILVFSELGCNVCADAETTFAKTIYKKYGEGSVVAIIHATNRRFVKGYIQMNQVPFPVYYCSNDNFLNENHIENTPIIFVINENETVVAAHFPLPGQPVYSEPFHNFCNFYMERNFL